MDHREYIRDVEGSSVAVLMIHGIAGTPAHFRDLLPVIPENWTVHNILLDGHGKKVEDFGKTSMKKWKAQAKAAVDALLAKHEKLLIVAHSMGTLFAIQAAIDHPDRIPALFLLAAPMRPWVRFSTMLTCLRVSRGDIREDDAPANAMKNATCIQLDRRLWKYISWAPRMIELLVEIRRVRKLLPQLTVPTHTYQSKVDELVSDRSCRDLEKHSIIHTTRLYSSGHFAYGAEDIKLLQTQLAALIEKIGATNSFPRGEAVSKAD